MEKFIKGDIVIIPFPFSDLTQNKRRPALIISVLNGDDIILCQITSQNVKDNYAISIEDGDFKSGELRQASNTRPNRIFTADKHIVLYKAASLKDKKFNEVLDRLIEIIKN
jgi:mRNA interferase MazF